MGDWRDLEVDVEIHDSGMDVDSYIGASAISASGNQCVGPPIVDLDISLVGWSDEAACLGANRKKFFPEKNQRAAEAAAKAACAGCGVRVECLDYALQFSDNALPGVYGGLNQNERNQINRKKRKIEVANAAA